MRDRYNKNYELQKIASKWSLVSEKPGCFNFEIIRHEL